MSRDFSVGKTASKSCRVRLVTGLNQCSSIPGKGKILVPCYNVCIDPVIDPVEYPEVQACGQCSL